MKRFIKVTILFAIIMGIAASNLAAQEQYPNKPVTLIHAFAPGGSTDLAARAFAAVAPKYLKQPVVVVPKPGGAGVVALQFLALAKPDGYVLHLGRPGEFTYGPFIDKVSYDVATDFIPIAQVATDDLSVTVSTKTPWKTIEDLIEAAKKEPGKIKFASSGTTASTRLVFEAFCHMVGIKLTCVPFKGAGPAAIAVAGGHIPIICGAISETLPHILRGDIRPLLMMGNRHAKEYPQVPLPKDKGWDFDMSSWQTLFAAKGTPPAIISQLESVSKEVVEDKEFQTAMSTMGSKEVFVSGKNFAVYWEGERKRMGVLVKELGISNIK